MPEQKQPIGPSLNNFKVTITAKARHAILWEARKLFRSQKEMAEYLGLNQMLVGRMLNLKWFCNLKQERFSNDPKWISVFKKLMDLTGYSIYDIFPEELAGQKINNNIEVTREVPLQDLLDHNQEPYYLTEEYHDHKELQRQIDNVLQTLTPREEKIIRRRFGLGGEVENTLEEIGEDFEVTRDRVRQIEAKALRKLRHPTRSKRLSAFADGHKGLKSKPVPKTQRFTFPVFAKNRRHPDTPFVPVGVTTFPNINTTTVPEGFDTARLMVPFSKNLGALLPINFSAARNCLTLPALFKASQRIALKNDLINTPGLREEEWIEATKSFSRTDFSTGPVRSPGIQSVSDDSIFHFLAAGSTNWHPRRGFVCEELQIPVFHEVETLEYETSYIRSVYFTDFFKRDPKNPPRIYFQIYWNLPDGATEKHKTEREKDFQIGKERLLPWLRENVLTGIGLKEDPLNNTEWFLNIEESSDIMTSINKLERWFPEIQTQYLELIDAGAAQRQGEEEARYREDQERRIKQLAEKQLREELRQKAREEFEKPLIQDFLQNLDPLNALHLAFEYEFRIKDLPKAISLYHMSAEKGCPEGQFQLSQKYLYGIGVKENLHAAVRLLHLAVSQGLPEAEFTLARMYEAGKGVEENQVMAHSLYQHAGANGHPEALLRLGERYESGFGIQQNLEQAEICYRDAVECGSPGAIFNLERLLYRKTNPLSSENKNEFV